MESGLLRDPVPSQDREEAIHYPAMSAAHAGIPARYGHWMFRYSNYWEVGNLTTSLRLSIPWYCHQIQCWKPWTYRICQYKALYSINLNLNYGQHLFKTVWIQTAAELSPLSAFPRKLRYNMAYLLASKAAHHHMHFLHGATVTPLSMLILAIF